MTKNKTVSTGSGPLSCTFNSFELAGADAQSLVVVPGQFRRTSAPGSDVVGVQRLVHSMGVEVLRSDSADIAPPTIESVDLYTNDPRGPDSGNRDGPAPEDVQAIEIVAVYNGVNDRHALEPAAGEQGASVHLVPVTNLPAGGNAQNVSLIVQVADMAGNVAVSTGKGATLRMVTVDAGPDQTYRGRQHRDLTGRIMGFSGLHQPVTYRWDFGDGTSQTGLVSAENLASTTGRCVVHL